MAKYIRNIVLFCIAALNLYSHAQDTNYYDKLASYTLEELLSLKVTSASKYRESLNETPTTILILTSEDIENRGYISLNDIIADFPGFDIAAPYSDFTQQQYARGNRTGSFNERTLFMVNGIEHNILYCQAMNIAEDFPLSSIERVEVIYGPASAVYGANAFSGIINVITKSVSNANHDNVHLFSGLGSNSTYLADMTYLGRQGDIDISMSFRKFSSNRFDISDRPGYFCDEPSDVDSWGGKKISIGNGALIGNRALWGPYADIYPEYNNRANDHGLITKLKYRSIELGFNNLVTIHGNGSEYPYDKTVPSLHWKLIRNNGFIKFTKDINQKLKLSTLANYNYDGSSPESIWAQGWNNGTIWDSQRNAEMLTWKYLTHKVYIFEDFVYKPNKKLTINGGLKYSSATYQKSYEFGYSHLYSFDPATNFDQVIDSIGGMPYTIMDSLKSLQVFPKLNHIGTKPGNTFSDNEYGGFIQAKLSAFSNQLFLVTGARYDDNDIYGRSFNPRLGAIFNINKSFALRSNFGTAFQAPAPRNMYGDWGGLTVNNNLVPEEITSIDFGSTLSSEVFSLDLTGFYNKVTNSVLQGNNMPDRNIIGAELKFNALYNNLGVIINRLKGHVNFSFIDARFDKILTSTFDTSRSSNLVGDIAPIKFNIILDADLLNQLHWNFRINYVGEKETVISNPIEKIDSYVVINTSLHWRHVFKSKLTFFINISNLLNQEYYHPGWDAANAGEDLSQPSRGWYSSRLPQPGRSFMLGIRTSF